MKKPSRFTATQWIAPNLVKDGLVKNEPWIVKNAEVASEMFESDPNLEIAAIIISMVDEYALQYIQQAPILVPAMIKRANMALMVQQKNLLKSAREELQPRPKLSDLMEKYELAFPLRKISSSALEREHIDLFKEFKAINHSTLEQSIPDNKDRHSDWINNMKSWISTIRSRLGNDRLREMKTLPHLDWLLIRLGQYLDGKELTMENAQDVASRWMNQIADLMAAHDVAFNERWTLAQANDRAVKWHEELARKSNEEKFFSQHGIHWDQDIVFDGFPKSWKIFEKNKQNEQVHVYTIVPCNSGKKLFMEGKIMHHCVASYADSVVKGRSRIFSVRNAADEETPITTFEIHQDGRSGWRINQSKAHCNATPPAKVQAAVNEFVAEANRGKKGFQLPDHK